MKRMILLSSVTAMALLSSVALATAQQPGAGAGAAEKGGSAGTMEKAPAAPAGGMKGAAAPGEMRSGRSSEGGPATSPGMNTQNAQKMNTPEEHAKSASDKQANPATPNSGTPMNNQRATGEQGQHGTMSPADTDHSANNGKGDHDQRGAAKEPAKPDDHAAGGQRNQQGAEAQTKKSSEGRSSVGPTKVTSEETTRLRTVQKNVKVKEAVNINVDVSVGRPVPHTITEYWAPVPEDIYSIVPLWRDYRIVRIHDELLIIDPETFEIVYVIPG